MPPYKLQRCIGLQVFSDGGFSNATGSAAVVLVGCCFEEGEIQREVLGTKGVYLSKVHSSFEAELIALDVATEIAEQLQMRV